MKLNSRRPATGQILAVAVTLSTLATGRSLSAEDQPRIQIDRGLAISQAMIDVLDARLSIGRFRRQQLNSLLERGHASWLEVARQEVVVDSLAAQRASREELHGRLSALKQRLTTLAAPQPSVAETEVIKLTLPGSVRLVAWCEMQPALQQSSPNAKLSAQASKKAGHAGQPQPAAERIPDLQDRLDRLAKLNSDQAWVEVERQRTEHALALASAEARLEAALCAMQRRVDPIVEPNEWLARLPAAKTIRPPSRNDALRHATLRVAAFEASAVGAQQAAELELQRARRTWVALEHLHEQGLASDQEREAARARVATAETVLRQESTRKELLQTSYHELRAADSGTATEIPRGAPRQITAEDLPEVLLRDPSAVRHWVELCWLKSNLAAREAACAAKLTMHRRLRDRLVEADGDSPRLRREIECARLDVEWLEACRAAANEQQTALAWEASRFVEQILVEHAAGPSTDSTPDPRKETRSRMVGLSTAAPVRVCYLESAWAMQVAKPRRWIPDTVMTYSFSFPDRFGYTGHARKHYHADTRGNVGDLTSDDTLFAWAARPSLANITGDLSPPRVIRDFSFPTYTDYYRFGNGRPNRRWRPIGAPPWYLPGSPTSLPRFRYQYRDRGD